MNRAEILTAAIHGRAGLEGLSGHLEQAHGVVVSDLAELDAGVFRVQLGDGRRWVARVFPAARPLQDVQADAAVLRLLEREGYPAERVAGDEPVSALAGQGVLVTQYVAGERVDRDQASFRALGDLLGRLHALPRPRDAAEAREAGALHHWSMSGGGPAEDLAAAVSWLRDYQWRLPTDGRAECEPLLAAAARAEDGRGLPRALIHPDPLPKNAVVAPGGGLVVIDWTGAGRGPRLASLAPLLWGAAMRGGLRQGLVDAVLEGYAAHVRLEAEELSRLAGAMCVRPLVFDCYMACLGRTTLDEAVQGLAAVRRSAEAVAARVREALGPEAP